MTKSMTSGKPVKLILLFALPLIVGNIFQQFYSMADTVIVGRTIGVNALAAVGCTGSVSFFILGFVMGFTSGLSILIAQRFGAGDEEGIRCSFAAGIMLSVALTIVRTFLAVALVQPSDGAVTDAGRNFRRCRFLYSDHLLGNRRECII